MNDSSPHNLRPAGAHSRSAPSKKRTAFLRVAKPRVSKVIDAISVLGQACDPARYEIYPQDAEDIVRAIEPKMREVFEQYRALSRKPVFKFSTER
jgi:hypothetical protein